jgi:hypothetical protein
MIKNENNKNPSEQSKSPVNLADLPPFQTTGDCAEDSGFTDDINGNLMSMSRFLN